MARQRKSKLERQEIRRKQRKNLYRELSRIAEMRKKEDSDESILDWHKNRVVQKLTRMNFN